MKSANSLSLQRIIKAAVDKDAGSSATILAQTLLKAEKGLIDAWVLERITALVRAELRKHPNPNQLVFFPGFKNLSRKMPVEDGFVVLREMGIPALKKSAEAFQEASEKKVDPKAAKIYGLIDAMMPYEKNHHGLTVERFYELRASERPAIAKKAAEARADALTAQRRSEIAKEAADARWGKKATKKLKT